MRDLAEGLGIGKAPEAAPGLSGAREEAGAEWRNLGKPDLGGILLSAGLRQGKLLIITIS